MFLAHASANVCLYTAQLPFFPLRNVYSVQACSCRESLARDFGSDSATTITDRMSSND